MEVIKTRDMQYLCHLTWIHFQQSIVKECKHKPKQHKGPVKVLYLCCSNMPPLALPTLESKRLLMERFTLYPERS